MFTELLHKLKASPLTEEHYNMIQEGLAHCEAGQHHITMAKRAGVELPEHEAQLAEAEKRLRTFKQVYFPGR